MTDPNQLRPLTRKIPWQLAAVFVLLAASFAAMLIARPSLMLAIAGAFILVCGGLLCMFWRKTLAAQDAAERAKWDQANRNMDEFIQLMIDIMPNPA
ncbi:MAG: hypothetical protein IH583_06905, partial [Candidatus Aminicenantes bacterium]|nr:hypothetical protein [Candidatus Aminicenantes bacterium]